MRPRAFLWSVAAASAAFAGLWALLFYCELFRIRSLGMHLESGGAGRLAVRAIDPGSAADAAGVRPGDDVHVANGWPIASRLDVIAAEANTRSGEPIRLVLARDGVTVHAQIHAGTASWRHSPANDVIPLVFARAAQLATLGIAMLIAFKRPRDPAACAAAWMLATVSVTSVTLPYRFASAWRSLPGPVGLLLLVPFVSRAAIGPAIFTFFMLFPRRSLGWRGFALSLIPIGAVLGWETSFAWRVLTGRPGADPIEFALPFVIALNIAFATAGLGAAVLGYRRLSDVTDRRRMRVLLSGAVVASLSGSVMFLYYWTSDRAQIGHPIMTGVPAIGTLLFLALPLSFAYAILRHRLFDVSVIVRRGVQYALARGVLALVAPALVALLAVDFVWSRQAGVVASVHDQGWIYLLIGGAALAAHLRRERWLNALDRRFFRERYSAQHLLREITTDLRQYVGPDPASLLPRVVARIHQALHPETAAVLVRSPDDGRLEAVGGPEAAPLWLPGESKVVSMATLLQKPIETSPSGTGTLARELPDAERAVLRAARVELIVPVVSTLGHLEMLVALGPKRSEEPYSPEDIDLLAAIADALAMALDRAGPVRPAHGVAAGRCLVGRYRIDRKLGEGGMGEVYAATDLALEREVAVKLVRADFVASAEARDRFTQETRIAASFTHPNIVTVHDYGVESGGRSFIVMELLRGETLAERLARDDTLAHGLVLRILSEVCDAVEAAHARGFVHRDLKPSNVFLAHDDAGERAKVLDFGIAKLVTGAAGTTSTGAIVGTPRYMAPEQLRGEEASTRWDVWALTMIAFEMLTGRRAFDGATPARPDALRAAPREWRPFFDDALAFDSARRPATAHALFEGLAHMLTATTGSARV